MTKGVRRRLRNAAIILGGWTLLAVLFLPQSYLLNLRGPTPLSLGQAFIATAAMFYVWAALTPLVLWLGRWFPFEREVIGRRFALHLAAAFVVSAAHLLLLVPVNMLLAPGGSEYRPPVPVIALVVGYGATNVMIYWGLVAAGQAFVYFRRYQEREFRLIEAQLQSLRTQLHPHLLFNTLNAIAELIHQDPSRAERTLTRLSELLRLGLDSDGEHEVSLAEEVEFLRKYLEIQQTLLQDRLTIRWDIAGDTLTGRVPTMVLQPLVENAIRHGLGPRVEGGTIEISARRDNGCLALTVRDDGVGLDHHAARDCGVGLPNTRARLHHLYGGNHSFALSRGTDGRGVHAAIRIPFRGKDTR